MAQLNGYIIVPEKCQEMMNFYHDCLGGDLEINLVKDSPVAAHMPPEKQDKVLHAALTSGKIKLFASDNMAPIPVTFGNSVFLCLVCESKEEINTFYAKMSVGGKILQPLKEEFFGTYGSITDKFGIPWMFQFGMSEQK